MGSDVAEVVEKLPDPSSFKVHFKMCSELLKFVERISRIFPAIEAARPRCSSGIRELCLLNNAIDKTKLHLRKCSESSRLYLAVTGYATVSRCQALKNSLEERLGQIQTMVRPELAVEISHIMDDLRRATFTLDSSEEEAGNIVRGLLQQTDSASDSTEGSQLKALQVVASTLRITSPKAIVIEKRSIKKQLDKVVDSEGSKQKILKYLLYLLKKYGNSIARDHSSDDSIQNNGASALERGMDSSTPSQSVDLESRVVSGQHEAQVEFLGRPVPPEEFRCPLSSRLMHDPVVIASGETFERTCIQKWFDQGNDTCPKTKKKLTHLSMTSNMVMKDLISKWCMRFGVSISEPTNVRQVLHPCETSSNSIASFGSSMNDLRLPMDISNMSLGSLDTSYSSDISRSRTAEGLNLISMQTKQAHKCQSYGSVHEIDFESLSKLNVLQWESQCELVENVKKQLDYNEEACQFLSSENFVEPLVSFLKDAHDVQDIKAQKAGSQLLLAFMSRNRNAISCLPEEAFSILAAFISSKITKEALDILELLSINMYCTAKIAGSGALSSILNILDSDRRDLQERAIKILCNMSSNSDICSYIVSLECIPKLIPFLGDSNLAGNCLLVLKNLCSVEDGRFSVAETSGCIASVAEMLASASNEDQENAVDILLSLCSQRVQFCKLVMDEGVIPAVCQISNKGSDKGKASALELLRCLRDVTYDDDQECPGSYNDGSRAHTMPSEDRKSKKSSGFLGKILVLPKSSILTKKKK